MKKHAWRIIELDCGNIGVEDTWECHDCGACAGGVKYTDTINGFSYPIDPLLGDAFLPGSGLRLSDDCDEAKQQIADFFNSDVH